MSVQPSQRDPIAAQKRKADAVRRIGIGKVCSICGENGPDALIPNSEPMICARCQRKQKGRTTVDQHHVAGRANDAMTIPVDVNDHRAVLSVAQHDWEPGVLQNPNGCPLIAGAARIRGLADTIAYLLSLADWVVKMLIALSDFLQHQLGPNWWKGTPLERFAPKQ
jgi:hypothetical protein